MHGDQLGLLLFFFITFRNYAENAKMNGRHLLALNVRPAKFRTLNRIWCDLFIHSNYVFRSFFLSSMFAFKILVIEIIKWMKAKAMILFSYSSTKEHLVCPRFEINNSVLMHRSHAIVDSLSLSFSTEVRKMHQQQHEKLSSPSSSSATTITPSFQ